MKKLLKNYDLNSDMQYFELIVMSAFNGQWKQAKDQFNAMPRQYRKDFIKTICFYWQSGLSQQDQEMFIQML